jgi:hypothetical protein
MIPTDIQMLKCGRVPTELVRAGWAQTQDQRCCDLDLSALVGSAQAMAWVTHPVTFLMIEREVVSSVSVVPRIVAIAKSLRVTLSPFEGRHIEEYRSLQVTALGFLRRI